MDRKIKTILNRIDAVSALIDSGTNAVELAQQRHLDAASPERAYWHAGYRSALIDALRLLETADEQVHNGDSAGGCRWDARDGKNFH
jgi:hypothetical protein